MQTNEASLSFASLVGAKIVHGTKSRWGCSVRIQSPAPRFDQGETRRYCALRRKITA